jgi:TM2 domain-containing membrane protein YozV/predicted Ser/Thr protein kinase
METDRICPNCRKALPPDVPLGLCPECLIKSGFPTGTEPGSGGIGRFVPPPVEEIAKLFPQFEILSLIGKGGMGAVYKARQPGLDRFVALKVLPPAVANDPGFAERFNREARALARLSHPNIVAVYDFGTAGTLNYLVMEFVDGANLREIEQAGKLSSEQALAIVPQICEALQFAHNEGIVHRDIKPENLLIDKKGRVKITDFGIAKILDVPTGKVALTGAKDVVGTPHYMAPEQIEKPQTVDHRADIYSLGVVFYEMLTGELPLGKFAPPSKKVQLDVRLDEVVLHALEKEPERRYQQVSQVKTDIETIAGTPPPAMGAAGMAGAAPPVFHPPPQEVTSDKILLPTFLLAFFFGVFGAHRFYVGKIGTGIAQLFTLGGMGIWTTIDWILILCKVFTDGKGRRITNWWHPGPPKPPVPPKSPVPPVAGGVPSGGSHAMIVAPAVALLVTGCLKLFSALIILLFLQFGWRVMPLISTFGHVGVSIIPNHWGTFASFCIIVFSVVPALFTIYGAVEMIQIRRYGWAVTAAIVAITSCNLLGFAAGVWALVILLLSNVRQTFAIRRTAPANETWPWILGVVAVICLLFVLMVSVLAFLFEGPHAEPLAQASGSASVVNVAPAPLAPATPASPSLPAPTAPPTPVSPPSLENKPSPQAADALEAVTNALNTAAAAVVVAMSNIAGPVANAIQEDSYALGTNMAVTLQLQLAEAQKELEEAQKRYAIGMASGGDVDLAKSNVDMLQAKTTGDAVKIAAAQLKWAQRFLNDEAERYKIGTVPADDFQRAQYQLAIAQAQLKAAEDALANAQATGIPQPSYQWYKTNGQTADFTVTTTGTAPLSYQWYFGGTNLPAGATIVTNGNNLTLQMPQPAQATSSVPAPATAPETEPAELHDQTIDIGGSTDFSQSFAVEPGGQLTMDVDRGDVHITGGDQSTVGIRVTREVTHGNGVDASAILKEEHVTLQQTGNTISITAQEPEALRSRSLWGWIKQPNLNAHYEITVPRKFVVHSQTAGGDVTVAHIGDDVNIKTMGGRLDCQDIDGNLDGKTMGGDVQAAGCKGKLNVQTMGGGITVDGFSGPSIQASTQGGSVTADFAAAPTADCELSTSGGNVTARLPETATVMLDAHTEGGSVNSDFPVTTGHGFVNESLRGPINGGGPKLKMETMGGNIEVLKR